MIKRKKSLIAPLIHLVLVIGLGAYFSYAAIQGEFGIFSRSEIEIDAADLSGTLYDLETQVARMENLTRRLSDTYLDLDLLDEQARRVLGMLRSDEVVIR